MFYVVCVKHFYCIQALETVQAQLIKMPCFLLTLPSLWGPRIILTSRLTAAAAAELLEGASAFLYCQLAHFALSL